MANRKNKVGSLVGHPSVVQSSNIVLDGIGCNGIKSMDVTQIKFDRWKISWLFRCSIKMMLKGGEKMSEIRKKLENTMDGVLEGKIPLDTAEQVHLVAHRHIMDRYADDREARRIGDQQVLENLKKAQEMIKEM